MKPGYKQTEVGVIPEEWESATVGDVASFSGGSQPPRFTFKFAPTKGYVRLIQIRDYKGDDYASFIPEDLARKRCTADDIMIGRYGPPIFQILRGIEGAYNVALIKATPNQKINRDFFFNVLRQESLFQLIESLSRRSSGQTGVEMPALKAYGVPLPPLHEQRAIAGALSDVDALLGGLDRLIAKKRDLKQAAMQQLLTGQTRLPGFHDEWVVKQLRESARFCSGSYLAKDAYRYGEFEVQGAGSPMGNHDAANFREAISVIGRVGTVGRPRFMPNGCWVNNNAAAIVALPGTAAPRFVHLLLMTMDWSKATSVTAQPFLVIESLMKMEFQLPPVPEQTAIAAVLTDMDAELAALEQRRAKTRALKQGMMQELLTGRTRLVTN